MMKSLPTRALGLPVDGLNLPAFTLGDLLRDEPTLLVFLRHFG